MVWKGEGEVVAYQKLYSTSSKPSPLSPLSIAIILIVFLSCFYIYTHIHTQIYCFVPLLNIYVASLLFFFPNYYINEMRRLGHHFYFAKYSSTLCQEIPLLIEHFLQHDYEKLSSHIAHFINIVQGRIKRLMLGSGNGEAHLVFNR